MPDKGTEQATPLRKKKAREKGDAVRSRELLSASAMLGGVVTLGVVANGFTVIWGQVYRESVLAAVEAAGSSSLSGQEELRQLAVQILVPALKPAGLVMAASFCGALISGLVQAGGVQIHPNAVAFKFAKLNPIENVSHMFSLRSAGRLLKSLVPAVVMAALGWNALKALLNPIPVMSLLRLPETFSTAYRLSIDAACVMLLWAALDYGIEWRDWNQRLKMSKQEIKEEVRDAMGNPQIKAKVRQIQRAMRKRKVKADMSRATVVITNPTHYAVALEFSFETMSAPIVLAKGRDLLAAEIREEARWAGVPIIENPPLARSLYKTVEAGQSIPFELYAAVAGILAYLYRQRKEEQVRKNRETEERVQELARNNWHPKIVGIGVIDRHGFGGGM